VCAVTLNSHGHTPPCVVRGCNRLFLKTKPPLLQIVTFSMLPSLRMTNALIFIVLAHRLTLSLLSFSPLLPQLRISVAAAMLLAAPSAIAFTTPVGSLASPVKSLHARYIVFLYSPSIPVVFSRSLNGSDLISRSDCFPASSICARMSLSGIVALLSLALSFSYTYIYVYIYVY